MSLQGSFRPSDVCVSAAKKSKDPRTKIGAVLVRDRRDLISGYNGIPEGEWSEGAAVCHTSLHSLSW